MAGSATNSKLPCMRLPFGLAPFDFTLADLPIGEIFAGPRAGALTAFRGAFDRIGAFDFTGALPRTEVVDLVFAAGAFAWVFADLADFLLALPFPPVGTDRLPFILLADFFLAVLPVRLVLLFEGMRDLPGR